MLTCPGQFARLGDVERQHRPRAGRHGRRDPAGDDQEDPGDRFVRPEQELAPVEAARRRLRGQPGEAVVRGTRQARRGAKIHGRHRTIVSLDFTITLGNDTWNLSDVHFDLPKNSGGVGNGGEMHAYQLPKGDPGIPSGTEFVHTR